MYSSFQVVAENCKLLWLRSFNYRYHKWKTFPIRSKDCLGVAHLLKISVVTAPVNDVMFPGTHYAVSEWASMICSYLKSWPKASTYGQKCVWQSGQTFLQCQKCLWLCHKELHVDCAEKSGALLFCACLQRKWISVHWDKKMKNRSEEGRKKSNHLKLNVYKLRFVLL